MSKVVFPSFRETQYTAYEMRQLVSALEFRFQSLESNADSFFPSQAADLDELDLRYAQINHDHSIFDLTDVQGTPEDNYVLVWDEGLGAFDVVAQGAAPEIALNDLTNVNVPSPDDLDFLVFNSTSGEWESSAPSWPETLFDLTDTELAAQIQYDLLFNVDGSEWQPTGAAFQWFPSQYIQLGNAIGINWYDTTASSVEMLTFEAAGGAGGTVERLYLDDVSDSTTSTIRVDVTGGLIAGASFTAGNDYLVMAQANGVCSSSISSGNEIALSLNDVDLAGATRRWEGGSAPTDRGFSFSYVGEFTYAAGDLQFEFLVNPTAGTVRANNCRIICINLTDLGAANYVSSEDTSTTNLGTSYVNTASSITVGNGSDDYLIFACVRTTNSSAANSDFLIALNDGASDIELQHYEVETTGDRGLMTAQFLHIGAASTTYTISGSMVAGTGDINYAYLFAFKLNAFQDHSIIYLADPTDPVDANEYTLLSDSFTAAVTGDYAFWGGYRENWTSSNAAGGGEVEVDINSGGPAVATWDVLTNKYLSNNNLDDIQFKSFFPTTDTSLTASDTIDVDLRHLPAPASGTNAVTRGGLVSHSWETAPTDTFFVGDPVFNTQIDGPTTTVTGNLNVDGATVLDTTLNVIGATDLDSTLNVDGVSDFNANVDINNAILAIYDSTGADSASFEHDDIDFNATFVQTTDWNIVGLTSVHLDEVSLTLSGATDANTLILEHTDGLSTLTTTSTHLEVDLAAGAGELRLRSGTGLEIYDSTNTDLALFNHDGTDFNTAFTTTTDWNITGLTGQTNFDRTIKVNTNALLGVLIYDAGDASFANFYHDGTDFNTDFTTTTEWNITNLRIQHAGTMTSSNDTTGDGDNFFVSTSGKATTLWAYGLDRGGAEAGFFVDGRAKVRTNAGTGLRVYDVSDGNYGDFHHDGTDFHFEFVTTTDLNITGITSIQAGTVDADFDEITGTGATFDLSAVSAPSYSFTSDDDTGVTSNAADEVQVATGAIAAITWTEASSHVLAAHETEVGMTAFATGGQGSATQITSSYSVFSTVATGGDSSQLPATFKVGTKCFIKNDGAAAMDVFPSSGDDLGAGTDTAVSVAAGAGAIFVATVVDATWTQIL